jgi:hypothetical protein
MPKIVPHVTLKLGGPFGKFFERVWGFEKSLKNGKYKINPWVFAKILKNPSLFFFFFNIESF